MAKTQSNLDRFTQPFSSYIEKADGTIVWLVDIPDEQKERILARQGRSQSKVDSFLEKTNGSKS